MSGNGGAGSASTGASKFKQAPEYSKWYRDIERGNCAEVMRLLRKDPKWLQETGYDARTALHAAVIGGWGEAVVEEILGMCKSSGHESPSSSSQQSVVLRDLLDAVDKTYQKTAFKMAIIIGNAKVVRTIMRACVRDDEDDGLRDDKYEMDELWQQSRGRRRSFDEQRRQQVEEEQGQRDEERQRKELRNIIPTIFQKFSYSSEYTEFLKHYCRQVRDYHNAGEEFLFHSICYDDQTQLEIKTQERYFEESSEFKILVDISLYEKKSEFIIMQKMIMESIIEEARTTHPSLVTFLFKLQDNRGMTPLHAAVSTCSTYNVSKVLELIPYDQGSIRECVNAPDGARVLQLIPSKGSKECVNARDGAGRTPLHRAAAQSDEYHWQANETLERLLKDVRTDVNAKFNPLRSFYNFSEALRSNDQDLNGLQNLTALHLAVLHSHSNRVKLLLNHRDVIATSWAILDFSRPTPPSWMPPLDFLATPLNMAVIMGDEATLRVLLEDDKAHDNGRNRKNLKSFAYYGICALHIAACCGYPTHGHGALHYAADGFMIDRAHFQSLIHCVDLDSLYKIKSPQGATIPKGYSRKRGCINLLLEAGLNIWSKGETGNTPTPGLFVSEEDRAWWHEKGDSVNKDTKKNLTDAANAISVTAALVATASFVGPLQPPLGNSNVAAIVLSVIPSLPLLQAPLQSELQWTRRTVIMAVCLLLVSIMCVLVSFAAATMAVLPNDWSHRVSTFSTSMLGGAVCLVVLCLFTLRLVRLVFYKNLYIRRSYDGLT